jgi:hypothetical protein
MVFSGGQCGDDGYQQTPELGVGISAFARPRASVFVGAEVRASTVPGIFGCKVLLHGPVEVAPGIWESRGGFYAAPGTPQDQLIRTLFRGGVETPSDKRVILRATIGGGVIWSSRPAPVGSAAIALSSGGAGRRLFVELEHDITRVRQDESRSRYQQDSTVQVPLGSSVVTERIHPTWTTLRMGLELGWR